MKPPVEMPTELPQDVLVDSELPPVPGGPLYSDAVFGEPGLFHPPQVMDEAPSWARMWPFDETWPSTAADTKM